MTEKQATPRKKTEQVVDKYLHLMVKTRWDYMYRTCTVHVYVIAVPSQTTLVLILSIIQIEMDQLSGYLLSQLPEPSWSLSPTKYKYME